MSLRDTLRGAVKTIDTTTKSMQATVTFKRANPVKPDEYGKYLYPTSVKLLALVDWRKRQERTMTGVLEVTRPYVIFTDTAALMAATGGAGLTTNDQIILQDGTTGPLRELAGFIDAGTGKPFATEVFVG